MKNYLVNIYFPTCDMTDLSDTDSLRRELIKETLINILEFCKVDWCSMPCGMDLPQEESDKFRTVIQDEDVLILPNAEGKHEPLIHAKGGSSDPLMDLKNLWYGLEEKRADWIVCLTPVQQQEYIQMCFSAAQHAKWLSSDQDDLHRASYTGYQSCNTSMEDLVAKAEEEHLDSLLAKVEAKVSKSGYTIEEVLTCAVKYSVLKAHRLDVCTFSFEEILDEEEDSFVYLLNTQVRNRSFTKEHSEDIDELTLGEDEIWEEGEERELVLCLLDFTQVIELSCYPVLPHKLCEYLYALSRRFNSVCDSWEDREVGIAGIAETNLLLCKATEVVMKKCFGLLGITPESSSSGDKQESSGFLNSLLLQFKQESLGLPKSSFQVKQELLAKSLLQVGRLNHRDPPKKPNSRFQLFSVYIHITRDPTVQECMLFGEIRISDTYGVLYDGWGRICTPDGGTVALVHGDLHNQIRATNNGELDLGNPIHFPPSFISTQVVPLSSSMEISTKLYATTFKEDALFQLSGSCAMDFAYFWKMESDTECGTLLFECVDGDVRMNYALLRDAVDCVIKVRYNFNENRKVDAQVYASYGSDFVEKNEDVAAEKYYTASLYDGLLTGRVGEVPLKRSMMAVPAKGSIVIKAQIRDCDSKKHVYLDGDFRFDAQPGDDCKKEMRGACGCCSLSVSVVWTV